MNKEKETKARLLVADDQQDVRHALGMLFRSARYDVELVATPEAALDALEKFEFDVLLADLNYSRDTTSGREGISLIEKVVARQPQLPIIVMTAWGTIDIAVEAMRSGARNFIEKPWDNDKLLSLVSNHVELSRALRRNSRLAEGNRLLRGDAGANFIAESSAMRRVVSMLQKVAPSDANVLVTGEPGTGKSHVATLIHENSRRADEAFIAVNMGGLPESIFESEMFGHVRGAFTDAKSDRAGRFELADGGTLFMDEIGNIPMSQQPKLLRVLEAGEFERVGSSRTQRADVRVISATNADLNALVNEGAFRKDLQFRLNTVEVHIPPLRERRDDILPLAKKELQRIAGKYGSTVPSLSESAASALLAYDWPGNVRELSHVIERSMLFAESECIAQSDLALGLPDIPADTRTRAAGPMPTLDEAEADLIRRALQECDGNVAEAASILGLSRSAMYRRIEKHGL